ncbi:MAG: site-specific DNA-methyltransferase [Rectinemataceae bacterium]|jgi:site-specific DNA-methyltransferase (adenine-specific)
MKRQGLGVQGSPSPRNRSLYLSPEDRERLAPELEAARSLGASGSRIVMAESADALILGDALAVLPLLPSASVDLLVADPPYNMDKDFGTARGRLMSEDEYEGYTRKWIGAALPLLKPESSVYVCCDWRCSSTVQRVLSRSLILRNRITWEREKGRASSRNWKNAHEDIWFATVSDSYRFDADAVRQRRRVRAPYHDDEGRPKDWADGPEGRFRDTAASNLWTDLSVPFWSMPENTDHPTQKPEKLAAKLILSSSRPGDLVLDPFLGSGTSAVVAKKLGRRFIGIEIDEEHCLAALRRLELASVDPRIQGYEDGLFWERNSGPRKA